jgi:hypothetical protein
MANPPLGAQHIAVRAQDYCCVQMKFNLFLLPLFMLSYARTITIFSNTIFPLFIASYKNDASHKFKDKSSHFFWNYLWLC